MAATRVAEVESVHLLFRVDGPFAVYHCAKCEGCELPWGDWERTTAAFLAHP